MNNDDILSKKRKAFLNTEIVSTDFSVRTFRCLKQNNINTIGQLINLDEQSLMSFRGMGKKSVDEALGIINDLRKKLNNLASDESFTNGKDLFKSWIHSDEGKEQLIEYYKKEGTSIDVLEKLSARAYNLLILNKFDQLYKLIGISADNLVTNSHFDNITATEVASQVNKYLLSKKMICPPFYL